MNEFKVYKYRWVVLVIYMYITAMTQAFWLNFSAIDTFIEKHLEISAMQVGWLTMIFILIHIIISIPVGMLIDRKGLRFTIGIGTILVGSFVLVRMINPESYLILFIAQFGMGLGTPFLVNSVTKIAVTWFPENEEATAVSLGTLSLFIGMLIGLGLTPLLTNAIGYHAMLFTFCIMGIVGVVLFFVFVKNQPPTPPRRQEVVAQTGYISQFHGLKHILLHRDFLIISIIYLIGLGSLNGLITWLEKILVEYHHIAFADVGYVSGALILGGMIGCVLIPVLSDKLMLRRPFLLIGVGFGTLATGFLLFPAGFKTSFANIFLAGFFLISAAPILLTLSVEYTGEKYAGISVAWLMLVGNVFTLVVVPLMDTIRSSTGNFFWSILLVVIVLIIAFVLSILIKEPRIGTNTSSAKLESEPHKIMQ